MTGTPDTSAMLGQGPQPAPEAHRRKTPRGGGAGAPQYARTVDWVAPGHAWTTRMIYARGGGDNSHARAPLRWAFGIWPQIGTPRCRAYPQSGERRGQGPDAASLGYGV